MMVAWRSLLVALLCLCSAARARFSDILDRDTVEFLGNDYYGALGLKPTATDKEIKVAYRKLSFEFHPDRNPEGVQRFDDIVNAKNVLTDPKLRAKYDLFLAEIPAAWRPVYNQRRANPFFVAGAALVAFVSLITFVQLQQFKRDKARALNSSFYQEQLEQAMSKGKTEADFHRSFLMANPELTRTWRNTLGAALMFMPLRLVGLAPAAPNPAAAPGEQEAIAGAANAAAPTSAATRSAEDNEGEEEGEEEEEEDIPTAEELAAEMAARFPVTEDTPPEEKKVILKLRRKAERKAEERRKKRLAEVAQRKARAKARASREAARAEQLAARAAQEERKAHAAAEKARERQRKARRAKLQKPVAPELLLKILQEGDESAGEMLRESGVLGDDLSLGFVQEKQKELSEALLALLDENVLDEEAFWEGIVDAAFEAEEEARRQRAEAEQEAYEAAQRRKLRQLNGEDVSDEEEDAKPTVSVGGGGGGVGAEDDAWGAELAAKEAAKAAKKEAAKAAKAAKMKANKEANEAAKAGGGANQGKKERRR